jgi:two-component system NarL family sensor kinase
MREDDQAVTESRRPLLAGLALAVALAQVLISLTAGAASGRSWDFLLNHFVVTNAVIGGSLALAGWPIAWQRPRNLIGWLLLAGGVCYSGSAAATALLAWGSRPPDNRPFWRLVGTWANISWPWAITLFLPLTLLLFPTGRFLSPAWRWILVPTVVGSVLFAGTGLFPADNLAAEFGVRSYLMWPGFAALPGVELISSVGTDIALSGAALCLVIRFWRGNDSIRRQLLWLLLAVAIVLVGFTVPDWLGVRTSASLFAIALIPVSISIAVLRHQLLDIRLVVSRFALYLLLSGLVIGGYVGLVTLLDRAAGVPENLGSSALIVLALAIAFNPLRLWFQRRVDRLFYGSRQDPVRTLVAIGRQLSGEANGLQGALQALCDTLRLPSATLQVDGEVVAEVGSPAPSPCVIELRHGDDIVGRLEVGLRRGERRLGSADQRVIEPLANLLAVAVHATSLAAQLQTSRAGVLTAREEERRRLRRDLHDGLGPRLTGVILKAGVARRLVDTDIQQSSALLAELEHDTQTAIEDIRRLVYELRPPALDELGLVGALREYAASLSHHEPGGLQLQVRAGQRVDQLPAAIEVAAFRIATESLTNVVRHAGASVATLDIDVADGELRMRIADNGTAKHHWPAGVGLLSMRERADQLGGHFAAGPGPAGGQVAVSLPLAAA